MIDVTRLLCGRATSAEHLRYGSPHGGAGSSPTVATTAAPRDAASRRPVVVWNVTRRCNLRCLHCYTSSDGGVAEGELSHQEGRALLDDLAAFGTPAVLFSGGEPLTRPDLLDLARYARDIGHRPTLSTNGTLITPAVAAGIKAAGFTYVGISLDGMGKVNDHFRGMDGAFDRAVAAIRNLKNIGQRVGLRLTLTQQTARDLDRIFDFIEAEQIDRACFYHLVYTGRAADIKSDLTYSQSRQAMDTIFRRTRDFAARGLPREILTVDNHVDGVYLYRTLLAEDSERAEEVHRMLAWNGGARYSTGVGIGCVDFVGDVHPDQFWSHYCLGNIRQQPFSHIWTNPREPLLAGLRDRLPRLKGRCRLCRYQQICGGASRVRADFVFGDPWAPEPACYLSDDEIGLTDEMRAELARCDEDYALPDSYTTAG